MSKKVHSKPMEQILNRLRSYDHFDIIIFDQDVILKAPIEEWPKCDALISFYSKGKDFFQDILLKLSNINEK